MFPAVKNACFCLLISVGLLAQPLQAAEQRYVYLAADLPVAYQTIFYRAVSGHALWKLPLNPQQRQIIRLQELSLAEDAPFYWTRTRLDERKLTLKAQLELEIWQGPELLWQRSLKLERPLRLMGPELRGTGLAVISPLAELPAGALSKNRQDAARVEQLQVAILTEAAQQLLVDYQQHH